MVEVAALTPGRHGVRLLPFLGQPMTPDNPLGAGNVRVEPIRFRALDGCALGGVLYHAPDASEPDNAVVFATGTGVPATIYRWFSSYLANAGIPVLAFDYRGIGVSRPQRLRGFQAGFEDWAEYDAGAAIRWLGERFPRCRLSGVGHSIGALIIGASEESNRLSQLVCVGPHTGYFGDHRLGLRLFMRFGWRFAVRTITPAVGYFPARLLGSEDLPARIALQWSACTVPGFDSGIAHGDPERGRKVVDSAARLRVPALVISFSDDPWATEVGVRRFLHACQSLLAVRRVITPAQLRRKKIGHWGFFRRSVGSELWPLIVSFLRSTQPLGTRLLS
jgi:predicted alpha/beta hydrolase